MFVQQEVNIKIGNTAKVLAESYLSEARCGVITRLDDLTANIYADCQLSSWLPTSSNGLKSFWLNVVG